MVEDFPSNSQSQQPAKKEAESQKKVEPVVEGKVVQKKPSVGRRFKESFMSGESAKTAAGYVFFDVLIPAAKDALLKGVSQGFEKMLWGNVSGPTRTGARDPRFESPFGHVAYNRPSSSPLRRGEPRDQLNRSRRMPGWNELVFESRHEADEVLDGLFNLISQYQIASVADLYALSGLQTDHTMGKWGWTELRGSNVRQTGDGYLLMLPKPEALE